MIGISDELDILDTTSEKAAPPPKHWRPWFYQDNNFLGKCVVCGAIVERPGGYYTTHCKVFPCKDTSDTWGVEIALICHNVEFVDSLPEDETLT